MPAAAKSKKTGRLVARLTPADRSLVERAACSEGCSVSDFVVSHIRAAAKKIVRAHEKIVLNEAESKRFVAALLAPPRPPKKAMVAALKIYRETVIER